MARKRAAKKKVIKKVPGKIEEKTIPPLFEAEGRFFQELVDASNRYTNSVKQKKQYEFIIQKLQSDRKQIQDGDIKLPVMITLIPKLIAYPESDKKKVLKIFDDQIVAYQKNVHTLTGQMAHQYEDYLESASRNREFLNTRFKNVTPKNIVPVRQYGEKDEQVLFEAEFKDLIKDEDKKKAFESAKKEAIKRNVARKKKA